MIDLHEFFHEVILHGLKDVILVIPFLYITYVFIEYIEHKTTTLPTLLSRYGNKYGAIIGGALGAIPQCGFSTIAANLFSGGAITLGTTVAVFLSTSDEMLPILLSSTIPLSRIFTILIYKVLLAIIAGFAIDLLYNRITSHKPCGAVEDFCEEEHCGCEHHSILLSALIHTLKVSIFVLIATVAVNVIFFFGGEKLLRNGFIDTPVISHVFASVVGLIPNCAVSVVLTQLYVENIITIGTMLSGLFTSAGMGLLVLIRSHKCKTEIIYVVLLLLSVGVIGGLLADLPIIQSYLFN